MAELKKIDWVDEPSEATPVDSGNLKQMEKNAEEFGNAIKKELQDEIATAKDDVAGEVERVEGEVKGQVNVLWKLESRNQNAEFLEQTISLSLSDYDYLIIFSYKNNSRNTNEIVSTISEKGKSGYLTTTDYFEGHTRAWTRRFEYVNDMSLKFEQGDINGAANNHILVPYKIVGYKLLEQEVV